MHARCVTPQRAEEVPAITFERKPLVAGADTLEDQGLCQISGAGAVTVGGRKRLDVERAILRSDQQFRCELGSEIAALLGGILHEAASELDGVRGTFSNDGVTVCSLGTRHLFLLPRRVLGMC